MTVPIREDIPTEEEVREALKEVIDPEIGLNIVDLGLVYNITVDPSERTVHIQMTLTSPGCPLGPIIQTEAHAAVTQQFPAIRDVDVELVWSPPWDPRTMASEDVKMMLGIW